MHTRVCQSFIHSGPTLFVASVVLLAILGLTPGMVQGDDKVPSAPELTDAQWDKLDTTVDSAIRYLATQQRPNGSFDAIDIGQPAVTSLCVLAFLSRGHTPLEGPYTKQMSRAIDYVISKQRDDGLLCAANAAHPLYTITASYNHAINGLMLSELYGMTGPQQQKSIRKAIDKALHFSKREQLKPKRWKDDEGGWRYVNPAEAIDADLSITSWHLMFYRSARNAEFDVPTEDVESALEFVKRCFHDGRGTFSYGLRGYGRASFSRSMAGAGVVSLALAGDHSSQMAQRAGDFILDHPFTRFNRGQLTSTDRYFYGAFYCSQATYQLGGKHFSKFYPQHLEVMIANQNSDGSWPPEASFEDRRLGSTYSTAFTVLALTPPYQLLPIFQR